MSGSGRGLGVSPRMIFLSPFSQREKGEEPVLSLSKEG